MGSRFVVDTRRWAAVQAPTLVVLISFATSDEDFGASSARRDGAAEELGPLPMPCLRPSSCEWTSEWTICGGPKLSNFGKFYACAS